MVKKMTKAYILAFQRATNYGAVLQIFAFKKILERLGLTVEVIDYVPDWMPARIKSQPSIGSFVKRKMLAFTFRKFLKELNLTKAKFFDSISLKANLPEADFYFVGSDQVWNENLIRKDATYFLDFVPDASHKIGYAVSMGNNHLSDDFRKEVTPLIRRFHKLSVRETFVANFLKESLHVDSFVVLDPTLLLQERDYDEIRDEKKWNTEFIAVYSAMHDSGIYELSKYLRAKTNLPIVNLGYHFNGADKQEYIFGPGHWLSRIKESSYFITNSFHGSAFAILYKKKFFSVPTQNPSHQGLNARFVELLKSLDLTSRLVNSESDISNLLGEPIDYKRTYYLLDKRRNQSMRFLAEAIGEVK
ncbi:MAG: polysaccharide pyruvyl transferase family protein [Anaerolineales bacterium]|nr:polysaccharide pyruvyl transferase family protein [Anaerolineales bacterium]MCW5855103.1 polysaccharide pyruvyl transferase family protein [Anaerolineales bacterium]